LLLIPKALLTKSELEKVDANVTKVEKITRMGYGEIKALFDK